MITEEIYQEFKSQMNKENDVFTPKEVDILMKKSNAISNAIAEIFNIYSMNFEEIKKL